MSTLREKIGKSVLRKKVKQIERDKSVQTFDTAKQVIIIFDALTPSCLEPIKNFSKYLTENRIRNSVIGYIDQKEVPQDMLLWQNFDILTRKDMNWYSKPIGPIAEFFLTEEPDMLVVLNHKHLLQLDFMAQWSKAKFKIGCYTEEQNDYDLMINPTSSECDTAYYIEQIKHYVQVLNPS